MCEIVIDYKKITLAKCTIWGLELLLEMAIDCEMYERAAEIKKEINKREKSNSIEQ